MPVALTLAEQLAHDVDGTEQRQLLLAVGAGGEDAHFRNHCQRHAHVVWQQEEQRARVVGAVVVQCRDEQGLHDARAGEEDDVSPESGLHRLSSDDAVDDSVHASFFRKLGFYEYYYCNKRWYEGG